MKLHNIECCFYRNLEFYQSIYTIEFGSTSLNAIIPHSIKRLYQPVIIVCMYNLILANSSMDDYNYDT